MRQWIKPIACCLIVLGLVSPPIGEALPADTLQGNIGSGGVVKAQFHAVIGAEIEFGQIALQVLFPAMLIGPDHAALKDREEAFQRIRVNLAASLTGADEWAKSLFGKSKTRDLQARVEQLEKRVDELSKK